MIRLSDAAARLGCHVETLRIRVRKGELAAVRGAHGTYFVTESQLAKLRPLASPSRRPAATAAELEASWSWVDSIQSKTPNVRVREQRFIAELRSNPSLDLATYRLLSVHRLSALGLSRPEIGRQLGISARHVRRLSRRSPRLALRDGRSRTRRRSRQERRFLAQRLVAALGERVEAAGVTLHERMSRDMGPKRRIPAFKVWSLSRADALRLQRLGLTAEEVEAITLVGIPSDVLNYLMLHGAPYDAQTRP